MRRVDVVGGKSQTIVTISANHQIDKMRERESGAKERVD
jgi:hypothetical protein